MNTMQPLSTHDSWWARNQPLQQRFERLSGQHSTEILIIGAGITGLSTAIELSRRGHRVTVCEAEAIGAGTTAGSSGHLDAHPEMGPRKLVDQLGLEKAKAYTSMRLSAIDLIEQQADEKTKFVRLPAYQYSEDADTASKLRANFDAALQIGLEVAWQDQVPISRGTCGYKIANMARIDPEKYLQRLVEIALEEGVTIFEKTLVSGPVEEKPTTLDAGSGSIDFEHVVCATHCSFTSGNMLFAATPPYQSYLLVARVRRLPEDALYWDNSEPYYYVRHVQNGEESLLLIGGCDHRTGTDDSAKAMECLEGWARQRFEVDAIVQRWSAELFEPTDGLPMIGLGPGKKNIWVAAGLSGVGLTLGTAAASLIADGIEGKPVWLEDELSPNRFALSKDWVSAQATAAGNLAERVWPAVDIDPHELAEGEGRVGKVDGKHVAICRDMSGCRHQLNPICPHLGGVVHWNEAEQTWDCPLHGGRFTADGQRIYGPPESNLEAQ